MKLRTLTRVFALGIITIASFFMVGVTMSDFPPDPPGEYSPWGDLNDDGNIDIFDIVMVSGEI